MSYDILSRTFYKILLHLLDFYTISWIFMAKYGIFSQSTDTCDKTCDIYFFRRWKIASVCLHGGIKKTGDPACPASGEKASPQRQSAYPPGI